MNNSLFNKDNYLKNDSFLISFYDINGKKSFGNLDENIDLSSSFLYDKNSMILVDSSTVGHQNIWYIAIKSENIKSKIDNLFLNIILIFILIYSIISLVGIYLARLFLKPIKEERTKLNNFIKDTTHELNTPISAIIMSEFKENMSKKELDRIKYSANRISEIYKDLIYLFLDDKKRDNLERLELKPIILEQIDSFEALFSRKKLEIILDLDDNFSFKIFKDDFIRVFNNLFSNAIKYNKTSGSIKITLKNQELIIEDSGIGIDKNSLDDIFKRYFRATNQSGGFGLGLNIVSQICKRYDIKIVIESEVDFGTKFVLKFI